MEGTIVALALHDRHSAEAFVIRENEKVNSFVVFLHMGELRYWICSGMVYNTRQMARAKNVSFQIPMKSPSSVRKRSNFYCFAEEA